MLKIVPESPLPLGVVLPEVVPFAITNPIFVDVNGDGYTPPGLAAVGLRPLNTLGGLALGVGRVYYHVLRVNYSQYPRFADEFGHLIYKKPLSSYRLRLDYRFMGASPPGDGR